MSDDFVSAASHYAGLTARTEKTSCGPITIRPYLTFVEITQPLGDQASEEHEPNVILIPSENVTAVALALLNGFNEVAKIGGSPQ